MTGGPTYLVVPVENNKDGLVCRIGTGDEAITRVSSYAALVTASDARQILAVWKFHGKVTIEEAEEVAVLVAPSRLSICYDDGFDTLDLSHEHIEQVDVIDVRPLHWG